MSDPIFLVAGATGYTGAHTVRQLRNAGCSVRALVHREDERSGALAALGAEVIVGDMLEIQFVTNALRGVAAAYFVYPIVPGLLYATAAFANAARDAGVASIVNMSQLPARPDAPSPSSREHWLSERIFEWSGVDVTHLRPTLFADWIIYSPVARGIVADGKLRVPFANARHAPIACEDQARVIAAILRDPAPHKGQVYELYGPVEGSYDEHVETISRVLGRTIEYEPIPLDVVEVVMTAVYPGADHLARHAAGIAVDYQNGIFSGTNDVVERITGEPPMSLEEFVRRNVDRLAPPTQV